MVIGGCAVCFFVCRVYFLQVFVPSFQIRVLVVSHHVFLLLQCFVYIFITGRAIERSIRSLLFLYSTPTKVIHLLVHPLILHSFTHFFMFSGFLSLLCSFLAHRSVSFHPSFVFLLFSLFNVFFPCFFSLTNHLQIGPPIDVRRTDMYQISVRFPFASPTPSYLSCTPYLPTFSTQTRSSLCSLPSYRNPRNLQALPDPLRSGSVPCDVGYFWGGVSM